MAKFFQEDDSDYMHAMFPDEEQQETCQTCDWCAQLFTDMTHYPYCSLDCGLAAELDNLGFTVQDLKGDSNESE